LPPNPDKRPGKDGKQYVFHGCTVLVCDDDVDNVKVVFVVMNDGMLAFASPMSETVARSLSPSEVEAYFLTMPASEASDELRVLWKKRQETVA